MHTAVPFACFLSVIRPFGIQFEDALLQVTPVDKSKCPAMKDSGDVQFQLYTRYNPLIYQELVIGDDEKLMSSNLNFHEQTVLYFLPFMERGGDGSALMVREAYMQRGDTNVIIVEASSLEAGPWYITAAENTWYIGRYAAMFVDYLVSRGLDLKKTHFVGHSLGAQSAGVAGGHLTSGRVSRITGLDPALPLFSKLPPQQRLDPSDADFVDVIHTDAGIFGVNHPTGHADFWPNGGKSPQPGCELEVVIPQHLLLNKCDSRTIPRGYFTFYLQPVKSKPAKKTPRPAHKHKKSHLKTQADANEFTFHVIEKKDSTFHDIKKQDSTFHDIKKQDSTFHDMKKKESTFHDIKKQDSTFHDIKDPLHITKSEGKTTHSPLYLQKKGSTFPAINKESTFHDIEQDSVRDIKESFTRKNTDMPAKFDLNKQSEAMTYQDSAFSDAERKTAPFYAIKSLDSKKGTFQSINTKSILELDSTFPSTDQAETSHVKKRQKRFLPFFKRSEAAENENLLFRLLEFVNKNRRSIPVFTVMREINTLVKSANGELNHSTKERNNYIGPNPPVLPLATYNLELGSDSRVKAFVKRLLGLKVEGDRLTITGK